MYTYFQTEGIEKEFGVKSSFDSKLILVSIYYCIYRGHFFSNSFLKRKGNLHIVMTKLSYKCRGNNKTINTICIITRFLIFIIILLLYYAEMSFRIVLYNTTPTDI